MSASLLLRTTQTHLASPHLARRKHPPQRKQLRNARHNRIPLHRRDRHHLLSLYSNQLLPLQKEGRRTRVVRDEVELIRLALDDDVLPLLGPRTPRVPQLLTLRAPEDGNFGKRGVRVSGDALGDAASVVLCEKSARAPQGGRRRTDGSDVPVLDAHKFSSDGIGVSGDIAYRKDIPLLDRLDSKLRVDED